MARPDVEIFGRPLGRYALSAETTVMIDDSLPNLAAAGELGMTTVQFRSAPQLRT